MKFIHQREHLNEDDIVVIECSQMCNIRLMSDKFPAKITAPSTCFWNITIDTVSRRAISVTRKPNLTHKIKIIRRSNSKLS
jgi:hypothetical protein